MTTLQKTSKTALVRQMLEQADGTTITAICAATGWQPHSARAALSVLRKTGTRVERLAKEDGEATSRYRLTPAVEATQ